VETLRALRLRGATAGGTVVATGGRHRVRRPTGEVIVPRTPLTRRTELPGQRHVRETKGKRAIALGAIWFVAGLLITVVTYAQAQGGGVYFVAWGPMLYGVYRVVSGIRFLHKPGGRGEATSDPRPRPGVVT
jgi:hypothetical protein